MSWGGEGISRKAAAEGEVVVVGYGEGGKRVYIGGYWRLWVSDMYEVEGVSVWFGVEVRAGMVEGWGLLIVLCDSARKKKHITP